MAMRHPSPGSPIMSAAATRALSKATSPNSRVMPLIILSGRCSTPRWSMRMANADNPLCFTTSRSVRARRKHQSARSE
jgi:hypothetical protein